MAKVHNASTWLVFFLFSPDQRAHPVCTTFEKWYIQGELFGLAKKEKKLATVKVGHFSLEMR